MRYHLLPPSDLTIQMISLIGQTNDEVEAWISRSGGDMSRIVPAEHWQMQSHLEQRSQSKPEMALKVQVRACRSVIVICYW